MNDFEIAKKHAATVRQELADAVAGLALSEAEVAFLHWIESWDDGTVRSLAVIVNKARGAGLREV